jgi:conjugal transfer pilus assembly protein TraU
MRKAVRKMQVALAYSRTETTDQLTNFTTLKRRLIVLFVVLLMPISASASLTCKGHFVNPLTDICWSCIMPISIGKFRIGKGSVPKKRDRANPKSPLCLCTKK